MKVSSQILETISSGVYNTDESAFKELLSNSFDADATKVTIRAKPELDTISVKDDGYGMDYGEFVKHFNRISRSNKRDETEVSPGGRPLIGKIGIGFIAVSQLCDRMTVISKKMGSTEKIQAEINFADFRKPEHREKDFYDISQYQIQRLSSSEVNEQFTIVILEDLNRQFRLRLLDKDTEDIELKQYEGKSFEEILKSVETDVSELRGNVGEYWRFMINLADIIPIPYAEGGPIRYRLRNERDQALIDELRREAVKLKFEVDFDGVFLRRPIRLPELADRPTPEFPESGVSREGRDFNVFTFRERKEFPDIGPLSFKGYLYIQKSKIPLAEHRGLLIRLKNVAIGAPDPDFIGYPYSEKLFIPWVFGEVYVEQGLEQAMNVDRSTFKSSDPQFRELRTYIHTVLHREVFPRARDRQHDKRERRKELLEADKTRDLESFLQNEFDRRIRVRRYDGDGNHLVRLDKQNGLLLIDRSSPLFLVRSVYDRWLAIMIHTALVVAESKCGGDVKKLVKLFNEYLKVIM